MARITVLMGIYNCAPTLQEALDSLYAQTYKDFKIVMCDDGSKDDTLKIAEENAKMHENVIVIKNERNMGLNYTLNHCLEYADTEYCARMDGDDISLPTRFEKEIKFLDEHPEYAVLSTPMIYFDENGEFRRGKGGYAPKKKDFIYGTPHCHAPSMVRTDAYKAVDGYTVDPKLLRNEDFNLWMKMYSIGLKGYNLDECLYAMRDDREALLRRKSWKMTCNSVYSSYIAYKTLKLSIFSYIFCIKPIITYILPTWLYNIVHKKKIRFNRK